MDEISVDYDTECSCDKQEPVNYEMKWHEADIICGNCGGFIRDAG